MEVTALCSHMCKYRFLSCCLVDLLVLLAAQTAQNHATSPEIVPDRLQFFEYESVSVGCELIGGMKTWRVKQKLHEVSPEASTEACNTSGPSCTINPIMDRHSGEYWCENDEGGATDAVNISVTAGSVILNIPAPPVLEGSDLTLWCTNKKTDLQHISDFYKDGVLLTTSYESNFTIQNISKSDEGCYKCSISGDGDSPESCLLVSKLQKGLDQLTRESQAWTTMRSPVGSSTGPAAGVDEETQHLHSHSSETVIRLLVISVVLPLVVIGLVLCRKHKEPETSTEEDFIHSVVSYSKTEKV